MPFGIDDAIGIGLTAAGGLLGGFGSGGGGPSRQTTNQSSNWNQTQTTTPWAGFQPYLTGADWIKGIFPEAARQYNDSNWTPAMQDTSANWFNDVTNRRNIFNGNGFANTGAAMVAGQFDPKITAVGPIAGPSVINAPQVNPVDARAGQGSLDPTAALLKFMNGSDANPWLGQQGKAITDDLTRNMLETILPNIRSDAIASGQYGGSRGDMATGLAISRLNKDLAPALAGLASGTWENAQNRGLQTALGLNQQAMDIATGNAGRKLQGDIVNAGNLLDVQKFNTGSQLQNNAQEMERAGQAVANRGAGLNFAQGAAALQDQTYADLLSALGLPADYRWNNLARYSSILQPGMGFTTTDSAGTSNTSGTTMGFQPTRSTVGAGLLSGAKDGVTIANGLLRR